MRSDIQMWKEIKDPIYRDELFVHIQGVKIMPGAKELIAELKEPEYLLPLLVQVLTYLYHQSQQC